MKQNNTNFLLAVCLLTGLISFLSAGAQTTVTIQPNAVTGKDAQLASCVACGYSVRNFGTKQDFSAFSWTNGGHSSDSRSILEFDLSQIPFGATILTAKLSLYYNPNSAEGGHVSFPISTNACYLQRVTSAWNESTVTWNTQPTTTTLHQVTIPASTSSTQNYPNINVRQLVQDMVNNPGSSFGFMLRLKHETCYNKMILTSTDHPNAALRPKLVVTYSVPQPMPDPSFRLNGQDENQVGPSVTIGVFPNPANSVLTLNINTHRPSMAEISIYSLSDREIFTWKGILHTGPNEIKTEVSNWPRGIYMCILRTDEEVRTMKIMIE
ncbi:MAG: DNRLRE domain-containing protein [Bacteroidia bacterium]|nr:DNRLRE domain-containing protein [Bacteroidia bacterium]